jgi:hypothetical protein
MYFLSCKGCGLEFRATPRGLKRAWEHWDTDACNVRGDREAEGWILDYQEYTEVDGTED